MSFHLQYEIYFHLNMEFFITCFILYTLVVIIHFLKINKDLYISYLMKLIIEVFTNSEKQYYKLCGYLYKNITN